MFNKGTKKSSEERKIFSCISPGITLYPYGPKPLYQIITDINEMDQNSKHKT